MELSLDILEKQAASLTMQLCDTAKLNRGDILVVGCSTSEVLGSRIGTESSPKAGEAICRGIVSVLRVRGIYLAAQCCEHLNRAIVIEREAVPFADAVNVMPQPKAGGSFPTAAYSMFENPIVVEHIRADAGMDIGLTLIGMHLKDVAVPLRLEQNRIGQALVTFARTRPKFIGGTRAVYNEDLL